VLLAGTLALAACVQSPAPNGAAVSRGAPASLAPNGAGAATPRPVALLASLSGPRAALGQALANAAKLALDAPGAPPLDVLDTAGTADGAADAARAAVAAGAVLIIGPLTAAETAGAAPVAQAASVPVLAFTNDSSQARPGVWTLGITPAQQVRRLVGAETDQQKTRFAALLPRGDFGNAMGSALTQTLSAAGLAPPQIQTYDTDPTSMDAAMKALADPTLRAGPPAVQPGADASAAPPLAPPPFDALLLADTRAGLTKIGALLNTYQVGPPSVRIMGPILWSVATERGTAPLDGAWYAAPEAGRRSGFDAQYEARYGSPAPSITDFAFDAALLARALSANGGITIMSLTRADGFAGVDGVFALLPDGRVRRGLALFEIHGTAAQMIAPAPTNLSGPAI
jgi:branched-chain amino acid transport system substrate-binding protein